jgi:hypothetical protein
MERSSDLTLFTNLVTGDNDADTVRDQETALVSLGELYRDQGSVL